MSSVVLIIMDGWGYKKEKFGNAILHAKTPTFDRLDREFPYTLIQASGLEVGLPEGQMGNSEVGHLNIGAGRVVYQELPRISNSVKDGSFFSNRVLLNAMEHAKRNGSSLHLMGLLSDGGVHSHIDHIFALIEMAKRNNVKNLFMHPFLDGRDTPPKSALKYISDLNAKLKGLKIGKIASIMGRYYGMDRDNRWERTKKAYDAIVHGIGNNAVSAEEALQRSYENQVIDEFMIPAVIVDGNDKPIGAIKDGDSVIFYNFRSDRARQIIRALNETDFKEFERGDRNLKLYITCLTEYDVRFGLPLAFPPNIPRNGLGEILGRKGIRQFRTAETEKYAHVTFFFNGGIEEPYNGEDRILVSSPKVSTYDLKPDMSAREVTAEVLRAVESESYPMIIVNFANPDMVGHTGIFDAAVKAVEVVDECVGRIIDAALKNRGDILITSDHGNIEDMIDEKGEPITAHTTNPVPFYWVSVPTHSVGTRLSDGGRLADIAPTILKLLNIEKPVEMTGKSLIV
ncbi:MAG TPA: 2,3-bisphosphoglycerate-independent phosphoglycerate mutase [Nitrospinae bacterium]|nr:2,3-bisphosphoglycerate-independent phosphoglycerate mutase [Nitrospinota bacterium]